METPPPYAPQRKKSNTGKIIALVIGGIAVCCIGGVALVAFFGFNFFKNTIAPIAECVINFEVVHKSMQAYADEHDGKLPAASKWQDELAPYVAKEVEKEGKENPFKMLDPKGEWGCTVGEERTGMIFNSEFDGKKLSDARTEDSILVFESDKKGRNISEKYAVQDKAASPKVMGKPRGWFVIKAGGGLFMDGKSMNNKFEASK